MKRNSFCHTIAETVTKIMWANINKLCPLHILFDNIAKRPFCEGFFGFSRREQEDTLRRKTGKILLQCLASCGIKWYFTVFIAFANNFKRPPSFPQFSLIPPQLADFS